MLLPEVYQWECLKCLSPGNTPAQVGELCRLVTVAPRHTGKVVLLLLQTVLSHSLCIQ